MAGSPSCHVLVPGDWRTPTGGYTYDRRLVQALQAAGWAVTGHRLDGSWPWPADATRRAARDCLASVPDGSLLVADGLALGALPDEAADHAARLRLVALVHHPLHLETGLDQVARGRLRLAETAALRSVRRVVVTSRTTAGDVAAMGVPHERISVVEPGCDPVLDGGARPAHRGTVDLLCVATLTPRKGHAVLLAALAGLGALDWTLHLVGSTRRDPATTAALRAQALHLGLAGRVRWHGEVDAAALQAHYRAAELFVLPSLHEGYGMVVAEALAHGLPVVASRAGALSETLPPGAGLLVDPGDAAALQLALQRLIGDPALRAGLAGRARAAGRSLPGWAQQAARFAAVLRQVP